MSIKVSDETKTFVMFPTSDKKDKDQVQENEETPKKVCVYSYLFEGKWFSSNDEQYFQVLSSQGCFQASRGKI